MRGRENPYKKLFGKGYHAWFPTKPKEPSEAQVKLAKEIAEREKVNIPKTFTKEAYSQFISNYGGRR